MPTSVPDLRRAARYHAVRPHAGPRGGAAAAPPALPQVPVAAGAAGPAPRPARRARVAGRDALARRRPGPGLRQPAPGPERAAPGLGDQGGAPAVARPPHPLAWTSAGADVDVLAFDAAIIEQGHSRRWRRRWRSVPGAAAGGLRRGVGAAGARVRGRKTACARWETLADAALAAGDTAKRRSIPGERCRWTRGGRGAAGADGGSGAGRGRQCRASGLPGVRRTAQERPEGRAR